MWSFAEALTGRKRRPKREERRQHRYAVHDMRTPLGDLLDLSTTGMRVRADKRPRVKPGMTVPLWMLSGSQRLALQGRITRVRRTGWREWDVGVRFVNTTPSQLMAITALAQFGYVPTGQHGAPDMASSYSPNSNREPSNENKTGTTGTSGDASGRASASSAPTMKVEYGQPDHYTTLGVPHDATPETIHRAYRKLARVCHPDRDNSPEATAKFIAINQAYHVLYDAELRAKYDAMLLRAALRAGSRRSA